MADTAAATLRISGMHCAACADTVEAALRRIPGVTGASVSAAGQAAEVRWDPARIGPEAIAQAIRAAGYGAEPDTGAQARADRKREGRLALWRLFVAGLCAMQIMMLAEPRYVAAPGEIAPEYLRLLDWGQWLLSLPVLLFAASPLLAGAWRSLRARRIGMDVPMALGLAIAFVASSAVTFGPAAGLARREVYFDSLSMFVTFILAGRYLEMTARHRAEATLEQATSQLPARASRIAADGRSEDVPLEALVVGDRLRVPLGEAFPADGRIVAGATRADEALLTGESLPAAKATGDAVVAGSLNVGAAVEMIAERLGADTRAEAIAAVMRAARTQRPALLAVADRWASPFLGCVLALSCGAFLAWSRIDIDRAIEAAIAVLIVTCPCALSLAAPTALLAAASRMGRGGLLVRDLDAVARLAQVRTLFIDKTGTLTTGEIACTRLLPLTAALGLSAEQIAGKAASLATWSTHPLSKAIARQWTADATPWHDVEETPGRGIAARDECGRLWRLGSHDWIAGTAPEGVDVALACDDTPLAGFGFSEALREDAAPALARLRDAGVSVHLLSGDSPARVRDVAAALGIDDARGGLSPEDKLAALARAQGDGECVAMIGDGINDAPVLARADVAIAMGSGAAIARSQADAILLSNRLAVVADARALARRARRVVDQNLAWAAVYNATCVPLALTGHLPAWAAGAGMAASSLLVVLNSMRLGR